jgi:hypothetical protein
MVRSAELTLVNQASRCNLLGYLAEDHGADSILACAANLFEQVP